MSQKRDLRIIQSEKAIIEAGISALLANPSAGMSEIAERAGVGRATLYRHFESREDLVRKLAIVCMKEIDEAVRPYEHLTGRALIEAIIDVTVPMANRFSFLTKLWAFIEDDKEVQSIDSRMSDEMHSVFDQAKRLGDISKDLPTAWIVTFFDATLMAAWTAVESGDVTSRDATGHVKRSFFHGCGTAGRK